MKSQNNNLFLLLLICFGIMIIIFIINQRLNREVESLTGRPALGPQPVSQDLKVPAQPSKRKPVIIDPHSDPLAPMAKGTSISSQKSRPSSPEKKSRKTYEQPLEEDVLVQ